MSKLHVLTRSASTFLYALEFLISALILGIFSYYLAFLSRHHATIPTWEKAVEGMSGAAVIYTFFAVILTCFLGGITFVAFLAVLLDVLFCGCMIAIAILTRAGSHKCGPANNSPIGLGEKTSCRLQQVVFAVSIIGAFLFLVSAFLQVALSRSHKREKRYGPGPSNNYTSGSGKRKPWQRKKKGRQDAELGAVGAGAFTNGHHDKYDNRASDITGTTAPFTDTSYGGSESKYVGHKPTTPAPYLAATHEPTVPANHSGFQDTGVVGSGTGGGFQEMEAGQMGSAQNPYVHQDSNPYAEVHHGGYMHTGPETGYAR